MQLMIEAVAAAMLLGGLLLVVFLGLGTARALGLGRRGRTVAGLVSAGVGLGLGTLLVIATFFEDVWAPPPALFISVPPGFRQRWVVLIEDPAAPTAIAWHGWEGPFHGRSATIAVPTGGVLRVRSLAAIAGRGGTAVTWSDGSRAVGSASLPVPPGIRGTDLAAYERQPPGAPFSIAELPDQPAALAAYLRAHGG